MHVKNQAEIGVMFLNAKEWKRLSGKHQKLGERHGKDSASQLSKESALVTL